MEPAKFTATELRILELLADGLPHTRTELLVCLNDEMSVYHNLAQHLTNLRKKLRPKGEDIVCVTNGRSNKFRHVRLLSSPYK